MNVIKCDCERVAKGRPMKRHRQHVETGEAGGDE